MKTEDLIRAYIKTIIGADVDVEILDETVVLTDGEDWSIYIDETGFMFIGTFVDDDIDLIQKLKQYSPHIWHIYTTEMNEG